jgi:hypothetical protein
VEVLSVIDYHYPVEVLSVIDYHYPVEVLSVSDYHYPVQEETLLSHADYRLGIDTRTFDERVNAELADLRQRVAELELDMAQAQAQVRDLLAVVMRMQGDL